MTNLVQISMVTRCAHTKTRKSVRLLVVSMVKANLQDHLCLPKLLVCILTYQQNVASDIYHRKPYCVSRGEGDFHEKLTNTILLTCAVDKSSTVQNVCRPGTQSYAMPIMVRDTAVYGCRSS